MTEGDKLLNNQWCIFRKIQGSPPLRKMISFLNCNEMIILTLYPTKNFSDIYKSFKVVHQE